MPTLQIIRNLLGMDRAVLPQTRHRRTLMQRRHILQLINVRHGRDASLIRRLAIAGYELQPEADQTGYVRTLEPVGKVRKGRETIDLVR